MQPSYQGDKYILSDMDMYSRFSKFYPLKDMFAKTISKKIAHHCYNLGFPNMIFTDDALNFSAALTRDVFALLKIKHTITIPA